MSDDKTALDIVREQRRIMEVGSDTPMLRRFLSDLYAAVEREAQERILNGALFRQDYERRISEATEQYAAMSKVAREAEARAEQLAGLLRRSVELAAHHYPYPIVLIRDIEAALREGEK